MTKIEKSSQWILGAAGLVIGLVIGYFIGTSKVDKTATVSQSPSPAVQAQKGNVQFANHIQAKLPEQDVFIESKDDQSIVLRVEGDDDATANGSKTVFAASEAIPHDPFKVGANPLGPFPKGRSLGFVLNDWLAATGSGNYTVSQDTAQMDLTFAKLVPSATYTVWCSRITFPPNPNVVDTPCGAADGSQNVFKTDASGNGSFKLSLKPFEESSKETASVIAIAYHSDGQTYGANPGDFGLNSHVHLFYLVPAPSESPSQ